MTILKDEPAEDLEGPREGRAGSHYHLSRNFADDEKEEPAATTISMGHMVEVKVDLLHVVALGEVPFGHMGEVSATWASEGLREGRAGSHYHLEGPREGSPAGRPGCTDSADGATAMRLLSRQEVIDREDAEADEAWTTTTTNEGDVPDGPEWQFSETHGWAGWRVFR